MIFYIIIISCVFILFRYYFNDGNKTSLPKGLKQIPIEKGLPFIGVLRDIGDSLPKYLVKLSQKLGPIYMVKFGGRDVIVLNTYEYIKTALLENSDVYSGRWKLQQHLMCSKNLGIAFIGGHVWAQQRSFVLKTLKEFGMGKSRSTEIVQDECRFFLKDLENLNETNVDFSVMIPLYTANIISKFVMNHRFSHGDRELEFFERIMTTTSNKNDRIMSFFLLFPFLDKNEWLVKVLLWITSRHSLFDDCHKFLIEVIKEHKDKLDFHSEGDDLVDRFLIKQRQMEDKTGQVDTFTDWQLVKNALELICAGYDATSETLVWSFMLMAVYPDVQMKVHREIIDQIGNERLPTMNDKVSLNYTQAVMDEILRFSSAVTLSGMYQTSKDSNLDGYFIPKDTMMIPNLFACNRDPNVWEKPCEFYPEHFLSLGKNKEMKYNSRQQLIPFSLGKRQCLGESLARTEYFIFFCSVLQRFQVNLSEERIHTDSDISDSGDGFIRTANLKNFIFKKY